MKAKTYSTLQKTYDQSHLTCSTAVYYESQGNEVEALRCWRECLAQLQGHSSGAYQPRTETERALLQSLGKMQDQCHDRVGLLQAALVSKMEPENSQLWRRTAYPSMSLNPLPGRSFTASSSTTNPPVPQTGSSAYISQPTNTAPHDISSRLSRTPSPEKRAFLSTLRHTRKERKDEPPPKSEGAAAVKAATLAWSSISRAEGATLTRNFSLRLVDTPITRQNDGTAIPTFDIHNRQRPSSATPDQQPSPLYIIPARPSLPSTKHRPYSTTIPLGSPIRSSSESGPPAPPPHKYLNEAFYPTSYESLVAPQNECTSRCHSGFDIDLSVLPILPPKTPPKTIKASRLAHSNLSVPRKPVPSPMLRTRLEKSSRSQRAVWAPSDDPNEGGCRERDQEHNAETNSYSKAIIPGDNVEIRGNDRLAKALKKMSKGVDIQAALQVANEIVIQGDEVKWDDIAGLDVAKLALKEAVVYPFLRPDLFSGLREPARGMLLFGPPGTGKTMLARAVATESKSTFFSISASSLTSKYLGESEKLVRALFALAKALSPSIIFIDEIDSLLSSRNGSGEHEATRRIKTEFLIQWSDLARAAAGQETGTGDASRVLVLAATNLPWAIDDAARRRFVRRQYIPLPEGPTREKHLLRLLSHQKHQLSQVEMERLIELTDGFSGSDMTALAKDAAMGPLRSLGEALLYMKKDEIRPIIFSDFEASLSSIRPSVSKEGLQAFEDWAKQYGERV